MGKHEKRLIQILKRTSDVNIPFEGICGLLQNIGFDIRVRGSHHIFTKDTIEEILNLQPKGNKGL